MNKGFLTVLTLLLAGCGLVSSQSVYEAFAGRRPANAAERERRWHATPNPKSWTRTTPTKRRGQRSSRTKAS